MNDTQDQLVEKQSHYDPAEVIAVLDSFMEQDEAEHRETMGILQAASDKDRPGRRSIFGVGANPHAEEVIQPMFLDKTLEELDGVDWGEPTFQSTLVHECHRVRRVPLRDFTDEDLRRLIGQKFSLDYVVPLALMRLVDEPFCGGWFSGDVLNAVLSLPLSFWEGHPQLRENIDMIVALAIKKYKVNEDLHPEVDDEIIARLLSHVAGSQAKRSGA